MKIEKHTTPLLDWLEKNGITVWQLEKATGIQSCLLNAYKTNKVLPGLINAFKLQRATGEAVKVEAWLRTPLGINMWNRTDRNAWPKSNAAVKLRMRRYRGRKAQDR